MTAPANPLAVIDKAAQRAIEERDQHDANGAPEYADSWESLRGELREVCATVERLAGALDTLLACHASGGFVQPDDDVIEAGRAALKEFRGAA